MPRFCDLVRHGKGGHPPVIGRIVKRFEKSYSDRKILSTWQNMNKSGRRRRSCIREANVSLGQFMFTKWYQLETHRCATPGGYFLQVPDAKHLANKISESSDWKGVPISFDRINTIFSEWKKAGYITSKQKRLKNENGDWRGCPAIRTFTKKFFLELGGNYLLQEVKKAGTRKLKKIKAMVDVAGITLKEYLNPELIVKPKIVHFLRKSSAKPNRQNLIPGAAKRDPEKIRQTKEYHQVYIDKVMELFTEHVPDDGPPSIRWSLEEVKDNARRITDKKFRI